MNLDDYLIENLDDILDNSDKYVSSNSRSKSNKKVQINESANDIIEIEKIIKQAGLGTGSYPNSEPDDIDDLDENEYLEYNQEYFDSLNDYYDINCVNDGNESDGNDGNDENDGNDGYDKYKSIISNEEPTEDDCEDDIIDELYEKMHKSLHPINSIDETFEIENKSIQELITKSEESANYNSNVNSQDNGEYFFNLMNIFIKYYNNKFDKVEHFFSNIKDFDKGTTYQMEMFFDSIVEFKMFCECMNLTSNEAMEHLYEETEPEKISKLFEKWDRQIYMFELGELKLFSPSIIVCLNYIYEKNIIDADWNIYNLRDNE